MNTKGALIAALAAGFLATSAPHMAKAGDHEKAAAGEKNGCKGKDGCKGKNGCKGKKEKAEPKKDEPAGDKK